MKNKRIKNFVIPLLILNLLVISCEKEESGLQYNEKDLNEQLVLATLWIQTSAEYRALCYQTFNLAKINLDKKLAKKKGKKPLQ